MYVWCILYVPGVQIELPAQRYEGRGDHGEEEGLHAQPHLHGETDSLRHLQHYITSHNITLLMKPKQRSYSS